MVEDKSRKIVELMNNQKNIRNLAIAAHIDHGKTTLSDNLLYGAGMMSAEVAGKQLALDFHEDEATRGITIDSASVSMIHNVKGQDYLKEAVQINPLDYNAWSSLGGTYKNQDNFSKALECYKQALKVNPGDPYPLGNYLVLIIQQTGDLTHIERNHDMILKAIEKRMRQIEVMVDMPWAFFDIGLFKLLLGNINEAINFYLNGIRFSPDIWMIETTLKTLNNLRLIEDNLKAFNLVRQILHLGIIFHSNLKEKTDKIINKSTVRLDTEIEKKETEFKGPIVILAGGTDMRVERTLDDFRDNLINAFSGFEGTIIGGGTKSGISGIIGDIQEKYPDEIKTIGYVPSQIPAHVELDKRYSAIHFTEGKDFSIIEPIDYWYDLMKSGVEPNKVKLIGINGGEIAAFEFHAAIVFGAQVGIMSNSGRAASELITDPLWEDTSEKTSGQKPRKLFKILKNTSDDIYNFLLSALGKVFIKGQAYYPPGDILCNGHPVPVLEIGERGE